MAKLGKARFGVNYPNRLRTAAKVVPESKLWRSFDGSICLISEMTDVHLRNAINLLRRDGKQTKRLATLEAENARRIANGLGHDPRKERDQRRKGYF